MSVLGVCTVHWKAFSIVWNIICFLLSCMFSMLCWLFNFNLFCYSISFHSLSLNESCFRNHFARALNFFLLQTKRWMIHASKTPFTWAHCEWMSVSNLDKSTIHFKNCTAYNGCNYKDVCEMCCSVYSPSMRVWNVACALYLLL